MKKILITGSSGFIGGSLIEFILKSTREYEIIGIDKEDYTRRKGIISYRNTEFIKQDVCDEMPNIDDVYAVIHLAARAGVRDSHEQFNDYVHDNVIGLKNILNYCMDIWHPKKFIFASSSSVYGNCIESKKESDSLNPLSPYALTKVMGEEMIKMYQENNMLKGIDCCILRFFTVYGPHQRIGLSIRNFIDNITQDKPITLYGDGTQSRDFIYIDDLCNAIYKLINEHHGINGIFNLSSVNPISMNELIYHISKLTGKQITINYESRNIFDVNKTYADTNAIYNLIGWKPTTSLDDGLRIQIEWAKKELGIK